MIGIGDQNSHLCHLFFKKRITSMVKSVLRSVTFTLNDGTETPLWTFVLFQSCMKTCKDYGRALTRILELLSVHNQQYKTYITYTVAYTNAPGVSHSYLLKKNTTDASNRSNSHICAIWTLKLVIFICSFEVKTNSEQMDTSKPSSLIYIIGRTFGKFIIYL